MPVTLEELTLKYKSEIAAASGKDEAALSRVDAALRQSALGVAKLQQAQSAASAAARKAESGGNIPGAQKARALEESAAAKLRGGFVANKELIDNKPALLKLAAAKAAMREESAAAKLAAREQSAAAKATEREKTTAAKRVAAELTKLNKARDDSSAAAHSKQVELSQARMLGAASAAGAFALALGVAYGALVTFGLGAAGAARDARILGEALTGSASLGAEFNAIVNQLAAKVPLAKEKIAALAQEMSLLKLGRRDLQAGITSVAIVTSALGDSAGNAVKSIVAASAASKRFSLGMRDRFGELTGLAGTGLKKADVLGALAKQLSKSVPEVEKQLLTGRIRMADGMKALEAAAQGRFGKTIAAQMLSFDTQMTKTKERIGSLFAGVDIEPMLKGLQDFLSIFDEGTANGVVMRTTLTLGLQGIANTIGALLPLGKAFFLELAIGALETYLALRPIGRKIAEWVGPFATAENAARAAKVVVFALRAAFVVAGIAAASAIALVVTPVLLLAAAIGLAGIAAGVALAAVLLPFALLGAAVYGAVLGVQAAWDWLTGSASSAASNLIDSFIGWIERGGARVAESMKNLASKAANAFKEKLGIASPSKLFASYGRYTVQGLTEGVEQEAPSAGAAIESLGDTAPAGGARAGRGGGNTYNMTVGDVYFGEKKASEADKQRFVDMILEMLFAAEGAGSAGRPAGAF